MFERHPRLAIYACFGINPERGHANRTKYTADLVKRFDFAYKTATGEDVDRTEDLKDLMTLESESHILYPMIES